MLRSSALIEVINLRTWGGLLRRISKVNSTRLLFRGEHNARWEPLLATTLERRGHPDKEVGDYYRTISTRVRPQIESITGRKFDVPPYAEFRKLLRKGYDPFSLDLSSKGLPAYAFLIYTRHHGFPSPLLDWTRSLYIAAFFAFHAEEKQPTRRTIHVWKPGRFTTHGTNSPELRRLGPFVSTHARHVLQQCDYSLCTTFDTGKNEWRFTSQAKGFEALTTMTGHLWKYTLPSSERTKVLKLLDSMNLNAYSLFGTEESLMDTLALRELELHTTPAAKKKMMMTKKAF